MRQFNNTMDIGNWIENNSTHVSYSDVMNATIRFAALFKAKWILEGSINSLAVELIVGIPPMDIAQFDMFLDDIYQDLLPEGIAPLNNKILRSLVIFIADETTANQ